MTDIERFDALFNQVEQHGSSIDVTEAMGFGVEESRFRLATAENMSLTLDGKEEYARVIGLVVSNTIATSEGTIQDQTQTELYATKDGRVVSAYRQLKKVLFGDNLVAINVPKQSQDIAQESAFTIIEQAFEASKKTTFKANASRKPIKSTPMQVDFSILNGKDMANGSATQNKGKMGLPIGGSLMQRVKAMGDETDKHSQEILAAINIKEQKKGQSKRLALEFVEAMSDQNVPTIQYFSNEGANRRKPLGLGWIIRDYVPYIASSHSEGSDTNEVIGLVTLTNGDTYEWTGEGPKNRKLVSTATRRWNGRDKLHINEVPLELAFAEKPMIDLLANVMMTSITEARESRGELPLGYVPETPEQALSDLRGSRFANIMREHSIGTINLHTQTSAYKGVGEGWIVKDSVIIPGKDDPNDAVSVEGIVILRNGRAFRSLTPLGDSSHGKPSVGIDIKYRYAYAHPDDWKSDKTSYVSTAFATDEGLDLLKERLIQLGLDPTLLDEPLTQKN